MNYKLYPAQKSTYIREQEFGIGKVLEFSKVTSCLVIVAKVRDDLVGAHLSVFGFDRTIRDEKLRSATGQIFDCVDAANIREIFPRDLEKVLIFGELLSWQGMCNAAYEKLRTSFPNLQTPLPLQLEGNYRVEYSIPQQMIVTQHVGDRMCPPGLENW